MVSNSVAAPATVSSVPRTSCHWETGKVVRGIRFNYKIHMWVFCVKSTKLRARRRAITWLSHANASGWVTDENLSSFGKEILVRGDV